MNFTPFFLAQRILLTQVYHNSIATMTLICFTGIFIGSFSLALITAIMNGFETTIHQKIQGIHANIIIQSYGNDIDIDALSTVLQKEFPEIKAFSPLATHHILLRAHESDDSIANIAIIRGINPETEKITSSIAEKLVTTSSDATPFDKLFANNNIIIGKQLALNNDINIGDSVELLFIQEDEIKGRKITLDSHSAIISGIFDTGIDEFDSNIVYCALPFLEKLFPNIAIEQVNISLYPHISEEDVIKKLKKRIGLNIYSWKDLYPSLVSTLKLEKYVSFIIIALILLVASMNIISLLFMQITQKRSTIALLKAIGMSNKSITAIFFIMGISISSFASFFGIFAAVLASWILTHYPFITLPDTYYVTHLPVAMNWYIICAVFSVVILFSFFAILIPIRKISFINISHVLRFEG